MTPPPNISMWTILMILKSGNFFIPKQTFEYRNTSQFKNIYKALMKAKIFRIAKNIGMSFLLFLFLKCIQNKYYIRPSLMQCPTVFALKIDLSRKSFEYCSTGKRHILKEKSVLTMEAS